jgi:CRP/FNR family transcriptional regulator, cyclic AMP receptor protein
MLELEAILTNHLFFRGIDPAYLKILDGCAAHATFTAGEFIFHQGEEAKRFYLTRQGKVALELSSPPRKATFLETLGEGDILGSSWLFPPYRWHWDARAVAATSTNAFNAVCLRAVCEDDHNLGFELMKRFSAIALRRLQEARLQCLDIYRNPAHEGK